jgi:uncharacterized heparinase superfamily protein
MGVEVLAIGSLPWKIADHLMGTNCGHEYRDAPKWGEMARTSGGAASDLKAADTNSCTRSQALSFCDRPTLLVEKT